MQSAWVARYPPKAYNNIVVLLLLLLLCCPKAYAAVFPQRGRDPRCDPAAQPRQHEPMPPLQHFYGWQTDLAQASARIDRSFAGAASTLASAPEAQPLLSANLSITTLVSTLHRAVQLGYPYAMVTIADHVQACLLDNFVAHLRLMRGHSFPLVVICVDKPTYAVCQTLSAAQQPPVLCIERPSAPRTRDGGRIREGGQIGKGGLRRTAESWYTDLVWLKPSLLWLGLALGLSMMWSDLDVIHLQSPLPAFRWDESVAGMEWICETGQPNMASTGFGVVHPAALSAVSAWAGMRGFKYERRHASFRKYNEQGALWLLNEQTQPRMQMYKCLPKETFVSGCGWHFEAWRKAEHHYHALHFSCLRDKRKSMRAAGVWRPTRSPCKAATAEM
jgi:hypothetical protein